MSDYGTGHASSKVNGPKNRPPHIARIPKGAKSTESPFKRYDIIISAAPLVSYKNGPDTVRSLEPFTIRVQLPDGKIKFIKSEHEDELVRRRNVSHS